MYKLRNLKFLDARDCPKLPTFPEIPIPIKIDSLRFLDLSHSNIRELDQSIENLIGLEVLDLTGCKNLTTLPCSICELQNLQTLTLFDCSKLVRFPRKTDILNVDGCPLSLPKLRWFHIGGCRLSDCDFLVTLDCWETLIWLDLSRNDFVSLPACITKFVNLRRLDLYGCKKLRGIPELPRNVHIDTSGCELLEERFSTLTNLGAVIEASSSWHRTAEEPSMASLAEPTLSRFSLSSETAKRHRTAEEPSMASPAEQILSRYSLSLETAKRHRTAEESSIASSAEPTLSCYPLYLEPAKRHRTAEEPSIDFSLSSANVKRHCTAEEPSMASPAEPTLSRYSLSSETANRHRTAEEPSMASPAEPILSTWLSLSFETVKRHRTAKEPSMASPAELSWLSLSMEPTPVNPPKRQRTAVQASMVHFEYELTISPVPMFPDVHSFHHSTTPQLQNQEEPIELSWLSLASEPTKPRGAVKGHQDQLLSLSLRPTLPSTLKFRQ